MAMNEARVAGVAVDTRHWIGGHRMPSARSFTDLSPIDEQPIAEVASGGQEEADAAVRAAAEAFPRRARTPAGERAAILHAIAGGIERPDEELAQVETADNGAPPRSHRPTARPRGAPNFPFLAHRP